MKDAKEIQYLGKPFSPPKDVINAVVRPLYVYKAVKSAIFSFHTDKAILRHLVPGPLEILEDGVVNLQINVMQGRSASGINISPYNEAVINVPISYKGESGFYAGSLVLDDVVSGSSNAPTLIGQIIYGFPKRWGCFVKTLRGFDHEAHEVSLKIYVDGKTYVEVGYAVGDEISVSDATTVNVYSLKAIPSILDGAYDVLCLTRTAMAYGSPEVLREVKDIKFIQNKISFPSALELPIKEVLDARYSIGGFNLVGGEIVYDFLQD